MSQTANTPDVNGLFQSAAAEGLLSADTFQALQVIDIGEQIQNGMGTSADDVNSSEVTLVGLLMDDSGSMASEADAARDGHNMVIEALNESNARDSVLFTTVYLNDGPLSPFSPMDQAVELNISNYDPRQGTPLYDATMKFLGTMVAKSQEFSDNGVPVRTVACIVSDGADMHSRTANAAMVKKLVDDLKQAENHIVCAVGIGNNDSFFKKIFSEMGIEDRWILTPKNNKHEIREAFRMVSQVSKQASQGAKPFSQTALGGFGTP